jgi:hypothetical protein
VGTWTIHSDTYRRTRIAECTGGGGTVDRGDSWWIREGQGSVITWTKKMQEDELVRGTMLKLSPVMSWIFIVFHCPVESGVHPI